MAPSSLKLKISDDSEKAINSSKYGQGQLSYCNSWDGNSMRTEIIGSSRLETKILEDPESALNHSKYGQGQPNYCLSWDGNSMRTEIIGNLRLKTNFLKESGRETRPVHKWP